MTIPPVPFLRSKKFYSAAIGTVLALLPCLFSDPAMSRAEKLAMWQNFTLVTAGLWGTVIIAQGAADYAERRDAPSPGQQSASPTVQVNTGSQAANVQQSPTDAVTASVPVVEDKKDA